MHSILSSWHNACVCGCSVSEEPANSLHLMKGNLLDNVVTKLVGIKLMTTAAAAVQPSDHN